MILTSSFYDSYSFTLHSSFKWQWNNSDLYHNIILYYKYDINIHIVYLSQSRHKYLYVLISHGSSRSSTWFPQRFNKGSDGGSGLSVQRRTRMNIVVYHQDIKTWRVWSCCCVSRGRFNLLSHEFCAATESVSKCLYFCSDELWPLSPKPQCVRADPDRKETTPARGR